MTPFKLTDELLEEIRELIAENKDAATAKDNVRREDEDEKPRIKKSWRRQRAANYMNEDYSRGPREEAVPIPAIHAGPTHKAPPPPWMY